MSSSISSKREYFLQQLKQKDAIIESLLKEVRVCDAYPCSHASVLTRPPPPPQLYNPYTATPLSARALRERTAPAQSGAANVQANEPPHVPNLKAVEGLAGVDASVGGLSNSQRLRRGLPPVRPRRLWTPARGT